MKNWQASVEFEKQTGKLTINAAAGVEIEDFSNLAIKLAKVLQRSNDPQLCNLGNKILKEVEQ
jgi:hypothetical protein